MSKISLKDVAKRPGESIQIHEELDFSKEELYNGVYPFPSPVTVEGVAENKHGIIVVNLKVAADIRLPCARCAELFTVRHELDLSALAQSEENDDETAIILDENDSFDLAEYVRTTLYLEIPVKFVCREDCKGLCAVCGKNLNEGPCNCMA